MVNSIPKEKRAFDMAAKHKVVLFIPKPRKHTFSNSLPVALLRLASMLDRKKFDTKIITPRPGVEFIQAVADESKDALCLALSVMTGTDIANAIETIKLVRKKNKKTKIIWGGWHASILSQQTIESEFVDIVVRGQGERTFQQLIERLAAAKPLHGLLGVSFKENGKIVHNPDRPFEDINNFPQLPFDLVDIEDYVEMVDGMRGIFYVTSQGCPFSCKFCAEPLVFKQRWSTLSNDKILQDWEFFAKKHKIEYIIIGDDNFFVGEEKVRDFCKKLIAKKLQLKWGRVSGRVRQMLAFSDATWQLIKESGCNDVQIGAESGCQEVLDFINKQLNVDEVVKFTEKARQFNIKVVPAFILGLPTPEFKNASKEETARLLDIQAKAMLRQFDRCYGEKKDYDEIRVFAYLPYPGNPLFDLSCELGYKPPKTLEEWSELKPAPWIPKKMRKWIRQLTIFTFPYARDGYEGRHTKRFKLLQKMFHKTARWRLRHRFFALPVEYAMYRAFTDIRTKITGKTATEHQ